MLLFFVVEDVPEIARTRNQFANAVSLKQILLNGSGQMWRRECLEIPSPNGEFILPGVPGRMPKKNK